MNITLQIQVNGTVAVLESAPTFTEGTAETVGISVAFDSAWDGFSRYVLLWHDESETRLRLLVGADGMLLLPTVFTETASPFRISFVGENGDRTVTTNSVRVAPERLYGESGEETAPLLTYRAYSESYTVCSNGTYPTKDRYMTEDLTVAVPTDGDGVDTSGDTVTAEVLFAGYTAHDANGNAVTGTYTNPYNADTTGDTVTKDKLLAGYTAHDASGQRITGTNTYNADTTGDNVTAETMTDGTTAHDASGNRIVGSLDLARIRSESYQSGYMTGLAEGSESGVDTSGDTVTADVLLAGYTAHDASGQQITGTNTYNADTAGDTVSSAVLLSGYTAHNASGSKITGTYVPSASGGETAALSMNVTFSQTPPDDVAKLWADVPVTPEVSCIGYLEPDWQSFTGERTALSIYFDDGETVYTYGQTSYTPCFNIFRKDGTVTSFVSSVTASTANYDYAGLAACKHGEYFYVLLGNGTSTTANKRAPRLLKYQIETGEYSITTLVSTTYYQMYGGICCTEDEVIYMYTATKDSSSSDRVVTFYKYTNGTVSKLGSVTGYTSGACGMHIIGDKAYTILHESDGRSLCLNLTTETIEEWQADYLEAAEVMDAYGSADTIGACGTYLKIENTDGITYVDTATGKAHFLCVFIDDKTSTSTYAKFYNRDWLIDGDDIFIFANNSLAATYNYGRLPRKADVPSVYLVSEEERGTLAPVIRVDGLSVSAYVSKALYTDSDGYWQPANLYSYSDSAWVSLDGNYVIRLFTVGGAAYFAEQRLTWADFAALHADEGFSYTDGYVFFGDSYICAPTEVGLQSVLPTDSLTAGTAYELYTGEINSYTITTTITGVTADETNPTSIFTAQTLTMAFAAAEGYTLPETVTVTGANHAWDATTGTLTLGGATGAVSITVNGTAA